MADEVIRAQAVQSAPAGYTVPGAQEIIVKSVRALVDGTNAAASFLAVLQLIAPDDSVVWEAQTDTTIAAGGSASVSWFPRVGTAVAAASSGVSYAVASGENLTLASGGGYKTITLTAGTFLTSAAGTYSIAASGGFNGIKISTLGTYLVTVGTEGFPNAAVAAGASVGVALLGAGAVNFVSPVEVVPWTQRADGGGYQGNASQSYIIEVGVAANPVGLVLRVQAGQNTGGTADMSVYLSILQLDTTNP